MQPLRTFARAAALLLLALAAQQPARAAAAAGVDPLPLVGHWGIAVDRPTRSAVLGELGPPEKTEVLPLASTGNRARMGTGAGVGGEELLRYPSRGLHVVIDHHDRDERDPPIRSLSISQPATGHTREGLFVGQAEAPARAIAQRDFRLLAEAPAATPGGVVLRLADRGERRRTQLSVHLHEGQVRGLSYDFNPLRPLWQRLLLAAAMLVFAGAGAWAAERWWRRHPVRVPVASDRTTLLVSRAFLLAGGALAMVSLAACGWLALVAVSGGAAGFAGLVWIGGVYQALTGLCLAGVLLAVGRHIRP